MKQIKNAAKKTATPRNEKEKGVVRRNFIRDVLDQCDAKALQLSPHAPNNVRWAAVAFDLGISVHTIAMWARKGYIPKAPAVAMAHRYGVTVVKVEDVLAPTV